VRISVDIDGTLCANGPHTAYGEAVPLLDAISRVKDLYGNGHTIDVFTSRLESDRAVTVGWLALHGVPYHSLTFGKPTADLYIDDKAESYVPNYRAELNRKPLVICYSGGMDSLIAYYWAIKEIGYRAQDILLLNFQIGHPYANKERQAMRDLGLPYTPMDVGWLDSGLLEQPTVDNYIIPGRNLVFASLAASVGQRVWIVGVKFENHPNMYDKNSNFYRTATLAVSQAVGCYTPVETPFSDMSKTDMIRWAMKAGIMDQVNRTVSCYHPTEWQCGECGLCFKRAVALKAAGHTGGLNGYSTDPFKSKVASDFKRRYEEAVANGDFSHYSHERIDETLRIMQEL